MNSEELEQSLRTEFESYLKTVLAGLRQEAAEFKSRIETEADKHKAQLDEAFQAYTERFDSEHSFDEAFRGSVAEHLRLARDEGARITADAMAEAEKLREPETVAQPAPARYDELRDAIADISTKDSQSSILKSLVQHASAFAPRGAFFIIKNEHFVGWKVFGSAGDKAESSVREIHFPISEGSVLGDAVRSLSSVESDGGAGDNSSFLSPLDFGEPAKMHAIPLVARGRGVAVLYADQGDGGDVNVDALESLVRVAGLTVELLASSQAAKSDNRETASADFEQTPHEGEQYPAAPAPQPSSYEQYSPSAETGPGSYDLGSQSSTPFAEPEPAVQHATFDQSPYSPEPAPSDTGFYRPQPQQTDSIEYGSDQYKTADLGNTGFEMPAPEPAPAPPASQFETNEAPTDRYSYDQPMSPEVAFGYEQPEPARTEIETNSFDSEPFPEYQPAPSAFQEMPAARHEAPAVEHSYQTPEPVSEPSPFERPAAVFEPAGVPMGGYSPAVEAPVQPAPAPATPQARLSDRPVDLPIEVPEEERRMHNDARRFARLLVSEIKLYNEKKVTEGRESNDLYDRLREAIDRSREMYDKRVQPPVAAKFDYFHYEIVNSLAEGQQERLGSGYPGATV